MGRRLARELAMKALFARDVGNNEPMELLARLYEEVKISDEARAFSGQLVKGVEENQKLLDEAIDRYAIEWRLERIAAVEKNILRIALYEMLYLPETPPPVVINEAIEIAKLYGGDESPRFINGILGKVSQGLPQLREDLKGTD
ncbi:MAG TPA: transcription antitermination factor NusB [Clostridia bacterium]|nr:transcription antitermination factor NusB [Clostridia bacterium]